MLVSTKHKKLVLNLTNPERVTAVIPSARTFEYKGRELVAVPHRLDEVKVLNNIGIKAPSPVKFYYQWPGQWSPFHAQRETVNFLSLYKRAFVFNEMGSGKTMAALWAFDYLRSQGLVKKMLILCPLSTMDTTWGNEIFRHFTHLDFAVLHGTRDKRLKLLAEDADIYILNHDGLKTTGLVEELLAKGFDVLCIDELTAFRNASTARWKAANRLAQAVGYVWGMTGTPIPKDPTDAWAQCRLIAPDRVPKYFGRFREQTMRQLTQYKWVPRPEALQVVYDALQPNIRFTLEECVDLPEQVHITHQVPLSPEQASMYKEMMTRFKTEYEGGEVLAVNEAVKMGKLLQIAAGVAYAHDGTHLYLPTPERLTVMKEVIDQSEGKVIVFVPLTGALERIREDLVQSGYSVEVVHGQTSKSERDRIFSLFQRSEEPRVLVAHPGCMSHGVTLTAASTIIWYIPTTNNETYLQACARVRRPGQKRTTVIVHLQGSKVEEHIYSRLQGKQATQGILLGMLKEGG